MALLIYPMVHSEPIFRSIAASFLFLYLLPSYLPWSEGCNALRTIDETVLQALQADLREKLFGQHLAQEVIYRAVSGLMSNKDPKKPLVLSLHGWTGTGKSFLSKIIADNIYKLDAKSKCVHLFSATDFLHEHLVPQYNEQLRSWIRGNVHQCPPSLFIFDQMDKMHPELIDVLKPFLDTNDWLNIRHSIFIFLSNAGGELITPKVLEFWQAGKNREDLQLKDLEDALSVGEFYNQSSIFWHSSLINFIDFFVPFLPLQFRHIKKCVITEIQRRGKPIDTELAGKVAKDMTYFPDDKSVLSVKGCHTVPAKLDFYL
ncbi:hypothetical protein XELAEV_18003326mg [Xenopus laevis]|nr:hypothetical protein XELAEV_18003326mg [Xenopus laevis]